MDPSVNQLHLFRDAKDIKSYKAGEIIFNVGDPGDCLYVVKSGTVSLKHGDKVLETIGAGAMFGEMAMLDNEKRSAAAVADTECQVIPIDQTRFRFLVQQTPFFAQHVMKVMAYRMRRLTGQLGSGGTERMVDSP
jgi:CRP-like cAMP-binding protein